MDTNLGTLTIRGDNLGTTVINITVIQIDDSTFPQSLLRFTISTASSKFRIKPD